jgi:HK97 family phage major capsid protein/HK97 family phage prohead protease
MNRAYSFLEIRSVDEDKRIIEGIATTPDVALDGDVLEPRGIEFKLPIPFLFRHNSEYPLGNVISADVSDSGIRVRIQMAEPGIADYIDEKWRLIKSGTVRALSIGWKTINAKFDSKIGGMRISKSRWLELSAVPVGADMGAGITSIREADQEILAALGIKDSPSTAARINPAGASVQPQGKLPMKTIREQITASESTRAANVARMQELTDAAAQAGTTLDDAQEQEYDALSGDVKKLDRHLTRLREQETLAVVTARPVTQQDGTTEQAGSAARAVGSGVRVLGAQVEPGTSFTRYAIALYFAKGNRDQAVRIVESNRTWMDQTPEVALALRAPVAVGDTVTTGWAAELTPLQNITGQFVQLLRPATLIGRIPGFTSVPFNSLIPREVTGPEGDWVGEGARKPVGRMTFDNVELKHTKIAKIVAITEELARFSNPSAEARVRNALITGVQLRMDRTFVDPAITAQAGIRPASIFNGADTAAASGTAIAHVIADVKAATATFTAAELPVDQIVVLTTPALAVALSLMRTTLDAPAFPGMTPKGGNLLGFDAFVSSVVPAGYVEFFIPSEVGLADDGQASVDVSNQATLIMDDGGSPSATNSVNLWQENKIGIKAERFVNWVKLRSDSTYYITAANYGG